MKRRWKLSNPPKESGCYKAYYYDGSEAILYYDLESKKWYIYEEHSKFKIGIWIFGKSKHDRWSHI